MGNETQVWKALQAHTQSSDDTLLSAALSGDALARRALIERFLPLMYSACRRNGLNGHDADDVTQEIVIKLLRTLPQFRGDSKLSSWIYTISLRAVADFRRGRGHRETATDFSDPLSEPLLADAVAHDGNEQKRDADKMSQWIDALNEPVRSVMLRYYLAEESVTEIAEAVNMPEGTIKTHLFRGRQLLRQKMEARS